MDTDKIKIKLKRHISLLKKEFKHFKRGVKVNSQWYGNAYGGFFAHPDSIKDTSIVYSFGIGEDISFDLSLYQAHKCQVFCFDPTPKSIAWMSKQELPQTFSFYDYGISSKDEKVDFYLPKNQDHVSGSLIQHKNINAENKVEVQMRTLQSVVAELGHTYIDVLKMDVEGVEYDVVEDVLNAEVTIGQILIEFHDRFFEDGLHKSREVVQKLNAKGYQVFAVSDSLEEVSFIHQSLL